MSSVRHQVLNQFKRLHRTRLSVFAGDQRALQEARKKINEEFRKNQLVNDPKEIEKLVKIAKDVEIELKTNVIQAIEKEPGIFEVKVTPDTPFLDNFPYKDDAVITAFKGPKCNSDTSSK